MTESCEEPGLPLCPVCGSADAVAAGPYRHTHPIFDGSQLFSCVGCELVYVWPLPDERKLNEYNSTYFTSAHGGLATTPVAVAYHMAIAALRAGHVVDFAAERGISIRSVLEIGPGSGLFHDQLVRLLGGITSYETVETDRGCRDLLSAKGVKAFGSIDDVPRRAGGVDLVVMSHVLEHVTDPQRFLGAAIERMRVGGLAFIEVPCRDFEFKPVPEPHVLFFDKNPMATLLDRVGLRCERLTYHGQTIATLRVERNAARRIRAAARARILRWGGAWLLDRRDDERLRYVDDPLQRAAVAGSEAHIEREERAAWLRVLATSSPHEVTPS